MSHQRTVGNKAGFLGAQQFPADTDSVIFGDADQHRFHPVVADGLTDLKMAQFLRQLMDLWVQRTAEKCICQKQKGFFFQIREQQILLLVRGLLLIITTPSRSL